jgi:hypothetical protein
MPPCIQELSLSHLFVSLFSGLGIRRERDTVNAGSFSLRKNASGFAERGKEGKNDEAALKGSPDENHGCSVFMHPGHIDHCQSDDCSVGNLWTPSGSSEHPLCDLAW